MGAEEEWGGAVSSPPRTSRVSSHRSETALSSMCEERGEKAAGLGSVPDSRNLGLWDLAVGAWLSQLWHLQSCSASSEKFQQRKKMTKINNKCNLIFLSLILGNIFQFLGEARKASRRSQVLSTGRGCVRLTFYLLCSVVDLGTQGQ